MSTKKRWGDNLKGDLNTFQNTKYGARANILVDHEMTDPAQ